MNGERMLALDWSAVAGSGWVATVLLLALVERLRRTFAARPELNALREQIVAVEAQCAQARQAAEEARSRAQAGQAEQRHHWERVNEQVLRPLERIAAKLEGVAEAQVAQAAALEHLERWLGREGERGAVAGAAQRRR